MLQKKIYLSNNKYSWRKKLDFALGLVLFTFYMNSANAIELYVTVAEDSLDGACDNHCSLRDAIQVSNQTPGLDYIFLPDFTYTISIPATNSVEGDLLDEDDNIADDLDIKDDLNISVVGSDTVIIQAVTASRILHIHPDAKVELEGVTFKDGLHPDAGGALKNEGEFSCVNCQWENNFAKSNTYLKGYGGAIYNSGSAYLYHNNFTYNVSLAAIDNSAKGGAIFNAANASMYVSSTHFTRNYSSGRRSVGDGGAIYNAGELDLRRSSLIGNGVPRFGRGIALFNADGGRSELRNCTIAENNSSYSDYAGGAIYNGTEIANGTVMYMNHVSIIDNSAGGLIANAYTVVKNSIIIGNYTSKYGEFLNCKKGVERYFIQENLLVGGLPEWNYDDCKGDFTAYNVETFKSMVYPLVKDENSGTYGYQLRSGSIAIDNGDTECPQNDQFGKPYDANEEDACDIGAIEFSEIPMCAEI